MVRGYWWHGVSKLLGQPVGRSGATDRLSAGRRPHGRLYLEILERRLAPAITLSVSSPTPIPEGDSGTTDMMFVVTRSGDTEPAVQVDYATQDGTAHAGTDYVATSGTVSFGPGETTKTIPVPIIGNTILQSDRSFTVALSNPLASAAFAPQQTFATGNAPNSVEVADFNGDGKADLVVANHNDGTVSVLLNTTAPGSSTPGFAPQETFAAGSGPFYVAVADFNGDGRPDLVLANSSSNTVSVLLNTTAPGATTPSFAAQETFATGSTPSSLAVADFNGDGIADLAVANQNDNTVSVLFNTTAPGATTPSFAAQQTFATGSVPLSVAVADLNGDGKLDLVVANDLSNTVTVLLNTTAAGTTTPSFSPQETFATGSDPASVVVADFNGDGKPDLAVANNASSTVSVLLNTTAPGATTPSFSPQRTFAIGFLAFSMTVADVNGDGRADLIAANSNSNSVSVLLNTTAPGASTPSFAAQETFATGMSPSSVAVADFNGDGEPDLVVANFTSNTVSVLLNARVPIAITPSFASQATFATGSVPQSVAVADFNGDGRRDLVVADTASGTLLVLLNTTAPGATTPSFGPQQTFATGSGAFSVAAADVNGDGRPDLIDVSDTVSVLLNTTAPGATTVTFAPPVTFTTGNTPTSVAVADFNGDGSPDLVVANEVSETVSVLLNTTAAGATTPSFAAQETFFTGSSPISVAVADFNGDGKPDLVVANFESGTVSVLLDTTVPGATTPSFAPQQTFATGGFPESVAVADFNGDGKRDLVVANGGDNTVSVLLNTTAAGATTLSFAPQQTFATGNAPVSVALADFNGDGKPDLVVANGAAVSDSVSVLLNTTTPGATTPSFAAQQTFGTGTSPRSVAVADFNGDGKPDLAAANADDNTVSVLLNNVVPIALDGSPATGTIQDDDAPVTMTIAAGNNQSATVNTAFMTNLAVDVENAAGNLVQGVSVTLAAPGSGPSGTFGGSATVMTDASGQATAPTFTANQTAGAYMVTASTTEGSQPSVSFDLTNLADVATHFSVSTPASDTAGTAFDFTVTALDQFENTATGYTGTVHFTSSDGSAVLPADSMLTNGTGTFSATLKTAGSQTITSTDTGNSSITGTSDTIDVNAAEATHFLVSAPVSVSAGIAFSFTVTAQDQFENTATAYGGTVHFTSSDGSAILPANSTLTSGTGTFSATLKTVGPETITATDTGNSSITGTSNTIDVGFGFAVGADAGGSPQVKIYDARGNPLASFLAFNPAFQGGVRVAVGDVNGDGVPDLIVAAGPGGGPHLKIIDGTKLSMVGSNGEIEDAALLGQFYAYSPFFTGGVFVAFGLSNGLPQIVTGAGPGGGPHVKIIDGAEISTLQNNGEIANGALVAQFYAYSPFFNGGVRVAAADLNADNVLDIVTGAGPGGGPHIKAINGTKLGQLQSNAEISNAALIGQFYAYTPTVAPSGGVYVAATDIGGRPIIVTGDGPLSAGAVDGPRVKVIDATKLNLLDSNGEPTGAALFGNFFAYNPAFEGGVSVGAAELNGNGIADIITGAGPGGSPHVKVVNGTQLTNLQPSGEIANAALLDSFFAFSQTFTGGVFVGGGA
jgi:hypothetical protein